MNIDINVSVRCVLQRNIVSTQQCVTYIPITRAFCVCF